MTELTLIIEEATAGIAAPYFLLPIDSAPSVYRERVYCYELYHQMRCLWPPECEYTLNGEVDKTAHPILRSLGADRAMPDLLVHSPGRMAMNHAVIEVKSQRLESRGIQKDLETLQRFRATVGYERACYLIYGAEANGAIPRVIAAARALPVTLPVELWTHSQPGTRAVKACVLGR